MGQIILVNKPDLVRRVGAQGRRLVEEHVFPIIGAEAVSKTRSKSDMVEVATRVKDHLQVLGVENARVIEHEGCFPAVFGEIKADVPNAPTILVGGHYDGQPSSKENWIIVQPHEPGFVTQGGETRFFGRGTSDDWGQVLTHAIAVKMIRELGLPLLVNIKFLIEGGEEVGSENMDKFITTHREMLKCDLVILTDSAPGRMNVPVVSTSGRGLVGANVRLKIGNNPPHSGENLAPSALEILQHILSLKDLGTQEIMIPDFYSMVRTPGDAEIAKLRAMPFDTDLFIRSKGLTVPIVTPKGFIIPGNNVDKTKLSSSYIY